MAQGIFFLNSDNWVYVSSVVPIYGDILLVDKNTDIDNIVISFGDMVQEYQKKISKSYDGTKT